MEFCNYLRIIHFLRLNLNSIPIMGDFRLENMFAQHLQVTIKNHGQVHGQFEQF